MTKEEYAELCYLLGKLKYCLAESSLNSDTIRKKFNNFAEEIKIINNIPDFIILEDNKKD